MKRELEVTITPDGKVSMQVKCMSGSSCEDFTKFLEDALGGEIIDRQRTAEFYQQEETANKEELTVKK